MLKLLFPAILKIVWIVASALPFNLLMWSSIVPLLFIVVPRYVYVVTFSRSICPGLNMVFLVFFLLLLLGFFSYKPHLPHLASVPLISSSRSAAQLVTCNL